MHTCSKEPGFLQVIAPNSRIRYKNLPAGSFSQRAFQVPHSLHFLGIQPRGKKHLSPGRSDGWGLEGKNSRGKKKQKILNGAEKPSWLCPRTKWEFPREQAGFDASEMCWEARSGASLRERSHMRVISSGRQVMCQPSEQRAFLAVPGRSWPFRAPFPPGSARPGLSAGPDPGRDATRGRGTSLAAHGDTVTKGSAPRSPRRCGGGGTERTEPTE